MDSGVKVTFIPTNNLCQPNELHFVNHNDSQESSKHVIHSTEGSEMKKLIAALVVGLFAVSSFAASHAAAPATPATPATPAAPASAAAADASAATAKPKKVKKAKKSKKAKKDAAASK